MFLSDFDYELPNSLVARYPLAERSQSRLLCLNPAREQIAHKNFFELPDLLQPGDCLILNDTRVIPARLFGQKESGGKVEILVERIVSDKEILAHIRASKRPKVGGMISLNKQTQLKVIGFQEELVQLLVVTQGSVLSILDKLGEIPLPPYLEREAQQDDFVRYQTVYSKYDGSCAAPTAGLHFDEALLAALTAKGIAVGYVTLHVGAGTFQPVRTEDIMQHQLHAEYRVIPKATCDLIAKTKQHGGRVIAVGTTTVRSLESACLEGELTPCEGDTRLFIYPGFKFRCVDAMITNFHLPKTSLLMLVSAFGGKEFVMGAYQQAVKEGYRFYSYGDAMFIEHAKVPDEI